MKSILSKEAQIIRALNFFFKGISTLVHKDEYNFRLYYVNYSITFWKNRCVSDKYAYPAYMVFGLKSPCTRPYTVGESKDSTNSSVWSKTVYLEYLLNFQSQVIVFKTFITIQYFNGIHIRPSSYRLCLLF